MRNLALIRDTRENVLTQLRTQGYLHLQEMDLESFEDLLGEFAKIVRITSIKAQEGSKSFAFMTEPVRFHIDYPFSNYVAWYCFHPCSEGGGTSQLKDMRKIVQGLTPEEFEILSGYKFRIWIFDDKEYLIPFTLTNSKREKYYYQPYSLKYLPPTPRQQAVIDKLETLIAAAETISIDLKKEDALIVNNDFMLHGRPAFQDRRRYLKRYAMEHKEAFFETLIQESEGIETGAIVNQ